MSELHRRATDLIAAAGDADGPTATQRARLRASVMARVGVGAAGGAAGVAAAGSKAAAATVVAAKVAAPAAVGGAVATASGAVGAVAAKAIAIAVVALVVTTGGYVALNQRAVPASPTTAASISSAPPVTTATPVASAVPAPATLPVTVSAPEAPAVMPASVPVRPPSAQAPATRLASPPPPPQESLERETLALRDALSSLRDGHAEAALRALDAQDAAFGAGALVEERAAARVDALCAAGRPGEARALATRFLDDHPRSLLAARVRSSCTTEGARP